MKILFSNIRNTTQATHVASRDSQAAAACQDKTLDYIHIIRQLYIFV